MAGFRAFAADLRKPDDFGRRPAAGGANQLAHVLMGLVLNGVVLAAAVVLFSVTPSPWITTIGLTLLYLVVIELGWQPWAGEDTVADTAFFGLGASFWIAVLRLTPSQEWVRWRDEAAAGVLIWSAVLVVALAAYLAPRIWPTDVANREGRP
jgi:hypothetical protein